MPKKFSNIIRNTLAAQLEAIQLNLSNTDFILQIEEAARLMVSSPRIVVTGMGKSGLIARKVAATLTSVGNAAIFLHPADALHGDIGHISKKEIVLAFSHSGETRELIELLPHIQLLSGKLIVVSGNSKSVLIKEANKSIIYKINKEGCPLELAPMASTTISLAIGDAIAAALIKMKNFKIEDFSRFHPAGSLGKRILTKVKDVMIHDPKIYLKKESSFSEILTNMVSSNLGAVLVIGSKGHLRGIITDGDLKRFLDQGAKKNEAILKKMWEKKAVEIMTSDPHYVLGNVLLEKALAIMNEYKIYILPVLNSKKKPIGILRMHDLIGFSGIT